MNHAANISFFQHCNYCITSNSCAFCRKPKSLLANISGWQYPDSKIHGSSIRDAATVNHKGDRTVPSSYSKTVLTTTDPIDKVFNYYKSKLAQNEMPIPGNEQSQDLDGVSGRSVMFHSESKDRPVKIHIISINTAHTSTTLVISQAEGEPETHIAWSQYETYDLNPP
tara:strand:+ start:6457 stop:6960 length:504 start_codon:yes stop_codon:yes gene_type:complete